VGDVLQLWFGELTPAQWFGKSDATDRRCRDFVGTHNAVAAADKNSLMGDADTALAAVIALDQLPRNIFRGTPRAFVTDGKAFELAALAVVRGLDAGMTREQRLFLYLPFEHSERREHQARAVELISALGDAEWTRYAIAHQRIIERFGRFPHRNAVLGRVSTPEEIAFLEQPGSSF
jgi:uncharacterized protein (DUF924 family)